MEHRRVPSSQIYGFSFTSTKPTRWKYLKIPITFSTTQLFFECYSIAFKEVNCQSVGILGPEIVLNFSLSFTGEMRVTLL